jgi:hypothetical protein
MGIRPGGIIALLVLVLLVLGACGGGSEPLTTQEYADELVRINEQFQEKGEALGEDDEAIEGLMEDLFTLFASADSPEDLGDTGWEAVSEIAEALTKVFADLMDRVAGLLEGYRDELSDLDPPTHLADLHTRMVAFLDDAIEGYREYHKYFKDFDTDITSEEHLERFMNSIEGEGISPDTDPVAAVDAFEATCRDLAWRIEAELGSPYSVCLFDT